MFSSVTWGNSGQMRYSISSHQWILSLAQGLLPVGHVRITSNESHRGGILMRSLDWLKLVLILMRKRSISGLGSHWMSYWIYLTGWLLMLSQNLIMAVHCLHYFCHCTNLSSVSYYILPLLMHKIPKHLNSFTWGSNSLLTQREQTTIFSREPRPQT